MTMLRGLALALFLAVTAAPALAQQEDAAESRATSFQAVQGAQKENVPGGPLLVAAYAVTLLLLVGYVARLGMMHQKTASEIERLGRALEARRKA
jgi:CcmD family protein